ncbi:MAG: hypothetical protein HRU25_04980 [Psychrobium sp.]|nr:hypothetical protein [Psychrobium sp.]
MPKDHSEFHQHKWVLPFGNKGKLTIIERLKAHIPSENIVYQSNSFRDVGSAVFEGMGIGPMSDEQNEVCSEMEKKMIKLPIDITRNDKTKLWFVYHKNLKSTQRIKVLLEFLKQHMAK